MTMRPVREGSRQARGRAGLLVGILVVLGFVTVARGAESNGARFYRRDCARCHGPHGRGDGPDATIFPDRPRNLRADFLTKYSNAELIRRIRRGSPLQLAVAPEALKARQHEVAVLGAYLRRLPTVDWRPLQLGQDLYVLHCASCHGVYGQPTSSAGSAGGDRPPPHDLSDAAFQRETPDDRLRALVLDGHGGRRDAPPKLGVQDAAAVVAYLRLLSPGYEIYSRFCANCHGDDGRGSLYFAEMTPRPSIVFDASYFARHDEAYVDDRIWHMVAEKKPHMPHLKHEVSETAAHDIIDFLKSIQD